MIDVKRAILLALPIASVLLLGSLPVRSATINISAAISIPENTTMNLRHTLTNKEPSSYLFGNFTGLYVYADQ